MLDALRRLRESTGLLSGLIIDEAEGLPSSSAYRTIHKLHHPVGYFLLSTSLVFNHPYIQPH
jgi:hypothetical protein